MKTFIHFQDVSKSFGQTKVVENLDLAVEKGEFLSLLGPSGSGKTTILMMLAGFENASSGTILMDGERIEDLPAHRRGIGVVFQNYALFPHMTIAENVAFPLQMRKLGKAEIAERVRTGLERVRLGHLGDRRPDQLSGGQQQRVALTRALVFEPKVVLMDEPLGALDKQLREEMQLEIRELHRRLGLTVVFVTHDQGEALTMSNRIAIFDKGRISQIGTAAEVYDRPANSFVAQFIGETNLLPATVVGADGEGLLLDLGEGARIRAAPATGRPLGAGAGALVSIRPERLSVQPAGGAGTVEARVDDVVYQGDHLRLHLSRGPLRFVVRSERRASAPAIGSLAQLRFDPADCAVFPA
ncbi:ABC transporter ATP-binding protein [Aurantimonas sp. Leaf443]|uniref:ABC transporter ATP-binding protein n=1 Tax=Aurantimonas sp. Leaf443 TaxID=1736378 RepID=UPI0006FAAED1|nr:ABC transporter ATP-binding protein [Aurantimonas sp. Leaf443]KQT87470.1 Fe3+/spermidine/putrescine ABC transporter ATP-binding protein [Aurantimonas sp. Leaf443]